MEKIRRKRVVITIEEKLKAIKRLDAGEAVAVIASEYGVGKNTISDWRKNRENIMQWCSNQASTPFKRKTMKRAEYEKVNKVLFAWFTQQRAKGVPVSGSIL